MAVLSRLQVPIHAAGFIGSCTASPRRAALQPWFASCEAFPGHGPASPTSPPWTPTSSCCKVPEPGTSGRRCSPRRLAAAADTAAMSSTCCTEAAAGHAAAGAAGATKLTAAAVLSPTSLALVTCAAAAADPEADVECSVDAGVLASVVALETAGGGLAGAVDVFSAEAKARVVAVVGSTSTSSPFNGAPWAAVMQQMARKLARADAGMEMAVFGDRELVAPGLWGDCCRAAVGKADMVVAVGVTDACAARVLVFLAAGVATAVAFGSHPALAAACRLGGVTVPPPPVVDPGPRPRPAAGTSSSSSRSSGSGTTWPWNSLVRRAIKWPNHNSNNGGEEKVEEVVTPSGNHLAAAAAAAIARVVAAVAGKATSFSSRSSSTAHNSNTAGTGTPPTTSRTPPTAAERRDAQKTMRVVTEIWHRPSSDNILLALQLLIDAHITPLPSLQQRLVAREPRHLALILRHCFPQLAACLLDPAARAALLALQSCHPADALSSYKIIVEAENPALAAFSLAALQRHNCLGLHAALPTHLAVPPAARFRGAPLTHATAAALLVGWLPRLGWSWKIVGSMYAIANLFTCQHQIFYRDGAGDMWYDPVFRGLARDGRPFWRRRHYAVDPGARPGTFAMSVLDNGVVTREHWSVVHAADDLSWALLHYLGAAERAGQAFAGAVVVTPHGRWPDARHAAGLAAALDRCGIQEWEMGRIDHSCCCDAGEGEEPPQLGVPDHVPPQPCLVEDDDVCCYYEDDDDDDGHQQQQQQQHAKSLTLQQQQQQQQQQRLPPLARLV